MMKTKEEMRIEFERENPPPKNVKYLKEFGQYVPFFGITGYCPHNDKWLEWKANEWQSSNN